MCYSGQCTDIKISMKINLNTQRTLSLIYQLRYLSYDAFKSFFSPLHFLFSVRWSVYWLYSFCVCVYIDWWKKYLIILPYSFQLSTIYTDIAATSSLIFLFLFYFFFMKKTKNSIHSNSRFSFIKFLELILWIFSDPFKNRVRFKCICVYTYF